MRIFGARALALYYAKECGSVVCRTSEFMPRMDPNQQSQSDRAKGEDALPGPDPSVLGFH